jgi:CRISPR-associated protein Cas6
VGHLLRVVRGVPSLPTRRTASAVEHRSANSQTSPYLRRTVHVGDHEIVGYAVEATELTAEESVLVQETGVGGRRRFGCGVFVGSRD